MDLHTGLLDTPRSESGGDALPSSRTEPPAPFELSKPVTPEIAAGLRHGETCKNEIKK